MIALIDKGHQFHETAKGWFRNHRLEGWATCPMTENGCVRVMSNAGYPFAGLTVDRVRAILSELVLTDGHQFWPDSISLLDESRLRRRR